MLHQLFNQMLTIFHWWTERVPEKSLPKLMVIRPNLSRFTVVMFQFDFFEFSISCSCKKFG